MLPAMPFPLHQSRNRTQSQLVANEAVAARIAELATKRVPTIEEVPRGSRASILRAANPPPEAASGGAAGALWGAPWGPPVGAQAVEKEKPRPQLPAATVATLKVLTTDRWRMTDD